MSIFKNLYSYIQEKLIRSTEENIFKKQLHIPKTYGHGLIAYGIPLSYYYRNDR